MVSARSKSVKMPMDTRGPSIFADGWTPRNPSEFQGVIYPKISTAHLLCDVGTTRTRKRALGRGGEATTRLTERRSAPAATRGRCATRAASAVGATAPGARRGQGQRPRPRGPRDRLGHWVPQGDAVLGSRSIPQAGPALPRGGPLPVLQAEASPRPIRVPARARTGGARRLAAACQRRGAARACCWAHSDPETTSLPVPSPAVKMALSRVCWARAALWGSAVAPGPFVTRRLQLGRSGPAWRAPR